MPESEYSWTNHWPKVIQRLKCKYIAGSIRILGSATQVKLSSLSVKGMAAKLIPTLLL